MIHRSCHKHTKYLSMGTRCFFRLSTVWRRVCWVWNPIEFWLWIRILRAGHRFATVSTKDRHLITVNTLKSIPIQDGLNRSSQPIVLWSINLIWLSRYVRESYLRYEWTQKIMLDINRLKRWRQRRDSPTPCSELMSTGMRIISHRDW